MAPKSDNHRFFISTQNSGAGVHWTSFAIFNRFAFALFATVLILIPSSRLSAAIVAYDLCIAALIACLDVAHP